MIAGIYQPVSGMVQTQGRITTLFHAMPGLNADDSGYENVITPGLLLGMSRREIAAMIPEIEDISELGEYPSLPVRTYSSGYDDPAQLRRCHFGRAFSSWMKESRLATRHSLIGCRSASRT